MDAVPYLRPIGLTCGIVCTVQSIIWIALSSIPLLFYNCVIPINLYESSDPLNITNPYFYFLYTRFFKNDECPDRVASLLPPPVAGDLLEPYIINIWMWFYFGMSIAWLLMSCFLIKICARKEMYFFNTVVFIWCLITLQITGMDCALTTLFGIDITNLQDDYNGMYKFEATVASVTMLLIAMRGVILLLLNIILTIMLLYNTLKIPKAADNPMLVEISDDDDHTSFSSKFAKTSFRDYPSQWHPPIDAFNYSNNNLGPPLSQIRVSTSRRQVPNNSSHLGWTLRRDISRRNNDNNSFAETNFNDDHEIPSPDYTPELSRRNNRSIK